MEKNTITQNLHLFIERIKDDINQHDFCTITFKIKEGRVLRYEKTHSVNLDEIKPEITD